MANLSGGYTPPEGTRKYFGSIIVGYYSGDDLMFASRVGTGFDLTTLVERADHRLTRWRGFDVTRPLVFWSEARDNLPASAQFALRRSILINESPFILIEDRHPFLPRNYIAISFV